MKRIITIVAFLLLSCVSFGQLARGNWMVGGHGNFKSTSYDVVDWKYHSINIKISPSLGYFIRDRVPVGLRTTISNYHITGKGSVPGTSSIGNDFDLSFGPFVRYYFLNNLVGPFNLFVEGAYGVGYSTSYDYDGRKYLSRYSFMAGPAYYINNSIAFEIAIGYYRANQFSETRSGLQAVLGFQIYLEKEK